MRKGVFSCLLTAVMAGSILTAPIFAETEAAEERSTQTSREEKIDFCSPTLSIGESTCTFPLILSDFEKAGMNVEAPEDLAEGERKMVLADNGETAFYVELVRLDDEVWASGFQLDPKATSGILLGEGSVDGMSRGEFLKKNDLMVEMFGSTDAEEHSVNVLTFDSSYSWWFWFDGEEEDAALIRAGLSTFTLQNYGPVTEPEENILSMVDVTQMSPDCFLLDGRFYGRDTTIQDLLDSGWMFSKTAKIKEEYAKEEGDVWLLYNGSSMVQVKASNSQEEPVAVSDLVLNYVCSGWDTKAELMLSGGLDASSSLEEFETKFGPAIVQNEDRVTESSVITTYVYEPQEGTQIVIHVSEGEVIYLYIGEKEA